MDLFPDEPREEPREKTYSRRTCFICEKDISANGLAWTAHMRTHVRAGEVYEVRYNYGSDPPGRDFVLPSRYPDVDILDFFVDQETGLRYLLVIQSRLVLPPREE